VWVLNSSKPGTKSETVKSEKALNEKSHIICGIFAFLTYLCLTSWLVLLLVVSFFGGFGFFFLVVSVCIEDFAVVGMLRA
jgi:hypothetical protein